jgi:hypothetical protein
MQPDGAVRRTPPVSTTNHDTGEATIMRTTMITGALAVVATTALMGGSATAQEPTTTHENGIVIECTGTFGHREVWTSVYENNTVKNVVQVVVGDNGLGASRESAKAFKVGRDVRATLQLAGKRVVIKGTAHAVGKKTPVHEEHDDAGQYITIDGTHRQLATDLTMTWKNRTVPLTCDDAFVYDLEVTRESAVD